MDFHDFPLFLGKSGKYESHPPKLCAGLSQTVSRPSSTASTIEISARRYPAGKSKAATKQFMARTSDKVDTVLMKIIEVRWKPLILNQFLMKFAGKQSPMDREWEEEVERRGLRPGRTA